MGTFIWVLIKIFLIFYIAEYWAVEVFHFVCCPVLYIFLLSHIVAIGQISDLLLTSVSAEHGVLKGVYI